VDTNASFYYFHLSNPPDGNWIDRIVCQKMTAFGGAWSDGSYTLLDGAKAQDKEWAVVDPATNNIYCTWTQFDDYASPDPQDSSRIFFARSVDGGQTWDQVQRINRVAGDCIDQDLTVEGAVPDVGPNGEIYVAWTGPAGLVFDKSTDQGQTWLQEDIFVDSMPGGWDFAIPGILRANGLPVTACDRSGGPNHGTIYINWSDQRNGSDDTDIWLAKSTDGGNTWSQPIRVNDDPPGKHQFFTWMALDQVTGYLWFVFYDRRAYSDISTDVYMAVSKDGGQSFTNFKVSESPFYPNPSVFFGDYTNLSVHDNIVRPIWARLHNDAMSIYTALVNTEILGREAEEGLPFNDVEAFPNPFTSTTTFSYKITRPCLLSLQVLDALGRSVVILKNKEFTKAGRFIATLDGPGLNLEPGAYFIQLITDQAVRHKKIVLIR
jgi:hypothetical protein